MKPLDTKRRAKGGASEHQAEVQVVAPVEPNPWWEDFDVLLEHLATALPADKEAMKKLDDNVFYFPEGFEQSRDAAVTAALCEAGNRRTQAQSDQRRENEYTDSDEDSDDSSWGGHIVIPDTNEGEEEAKNILATISDSPELIAGFFSVIPCDEQLEQWCICPFGKKALNDKFCSSPLCEHNSRVKPSQLIPHVRQKMDSGCEKHRMFYDYLSFLFKKRSDGAGSDNGWREYHHKDFYPIGTSEYKELLGQHEKKNVELWQIGMEQKREIENRSRILEDEVDAKKKKLNTIQEKRNKMSLDTRLQVQKMKKLFDPGASSLTAEDGLSDSEIQLARRLMNIHTKAWKLKKKSHQRDLVTLRVPDIAFDVNVMFDKWFSQKQNDRTGASYLFLPSEREPGTSQGPSFLRGLKILREGDGTELPLQKFLSHVWSEANKLSIPSSHGQPINLFYTSALGYLVPMDDLQLTECSDQSLERVRSYYRALGKLMGLSILNGIPIASCVLPHLYRHCLLKYDLDLRLEYPSKHLIDDHLELLPSLEDIQEKLDKGTTIDALRINLAEEHIESRSTALQDIQHGIALYDGDLHISYDDGASELLEDNEVGDMPFKSFRELFASYPREAVDCIVFH